MKSILKQVQSPFTDEMIKNLFTEYIYGNVDLDGLYNKINESEKNEFQDNMYLKNIFRELDNNPEIVTKLNYPYWNIVMSDEKYLDIPNKREDRTEIYRIYLNVKGEDKASVIREYIEECQKRNQDFKFKYSLQDGRTDEIIILSNTENFVSNVDIIKQITQDVSLGEPPKLVGKYENNIGIAEEYINQPIYSYTKVRLAILPIVIQKYILDHIDEFPEDVQKQFEFKKEEFEEIIEEQNQLLENNPEEFTIQNRWMNHKVAAENNIEIRFALISYVVEEFIQVFREIVEKKGFENILSELLDGYRLACRVSGISENGVFSLETENAMELYNNDISLLARELQDLQQKITDNTKIRDDAKRLLSEYEQQIGDKEK